MYTRPYMNENILQENDQATTPKNLKLSLLLMKY